MADRPVVEGDPEEYGFDGRRLARVDRLLRGYVESGRLPGTSILISRGGTIVHLATSGFRDVESGAPMEPDTVVRIYSMTKPVTSVAAMMLYEEGAFELTDPVSRFLPEFGELQVYRAGSPAAPVTEPAREPMRIWHLLTHTAGLTYGFHYLHPVDAIYRRAGYEWGVPDGQDLATACERWARLPLVNHPGEQWNYSVATDVLGRVVEVVSGQPLDAFFAQRILEPLGMADTGFTVPAAARDRFAALYVRPPGGEPAMRRQSRVGTDPTQPVTFLSGGGGLVSTAGDYHRFARMLLGGGEVGGVRLLGSRTVAFMTRNHLPGGVDIETYGTPIHAETGAAGIGFGLGFGVVDNPLAAHWLASRGEYHWGGAASTAFWVDPAEEIIVIFLTQLLPSSSYPLRSQLRQLVNQALVD